MLLATTEFIPGKQTKEYKGFVKGSTVRTKGIGKDFLAGFRAMSGGEINEYTEALEETRAIAMRRMIQDAERLGANAIIGIKLQSVQVMDTASEIIAYGTAVVVE